MREEPKTRATIEAALREVGLPTELADAGDSTAASTPGFYEIKRTRTVGPIFDQATPATPSPATPAPATPMATS